MDWSSRYPALLCYLSCVALSGDSTSRLMILSAVSFRVPIYPVDTGGGPGGYGAGFHWRVCDMPSVFRFGRTGYLCGSLLQVHYGRDASRAGRLHRTGSCRLVWQECREIHVEEEQSHEITPFCNRAVHSALSQHVADWTGRTVRYDVVYRSPV